MSCCFIFVADLDEEGVSCLRLDNDGALESPFARRPLASVRELQAQAQTVVVLPTTAASLHELDLPWLAERKARVAIPFALEEQLAQNVQTLHFAFDRHYYKQGRYLVLVIDKPRLAELMANLTTMKLRFDSITLDWFALQENESILLNNALLVHDASFKGALGTELFPLYLHDEEHRQRVLAFKDSLAAPVEAKIHDGLSSEWIALRLWKNKGINLCQAEFQQGGQDERNYYWRLASLGLTAAFFISLIFFKVIDLYIVNQQNNRLDQKIASIYHDFFPGSEHVISPRFRIEQLIKGGLRGSSSFWILLDKLAVANQGGLAHMQQFRFQNEVLAVSLRCNDFSVLERLSSRLQDAKVKVVQSQASTKKHKVWANLELSL